MTPEMMSSKEQRAYLILIILVISGLCGALITAPKVVEVYGITFSAATFFFSAFTYPVVGCICELWGKKIARQTVWLGLICQLLVAVIIQFSIMMPGASFWHLQAEYNDVLAVSFKVVASSCLAFAISQIFDLMIYQRIKEISNGKWLWLRSNLATYVGQSIDSLIFVMIVFAQSNQKLSILFGSIFIKIILSLLMTPMIYVIVYMVDAYLGAKTLAFKNKFI